MSESEIGAVIDVYVDDGESEVYVDVSLSPRRSRTVRFLSGGKGVWYVPEIGDYVTVRTLSDGSRVAHSPINSPEFAMPSGLSAGDVAITLSDGAYLHFSKQDDGTVDLNVSVDGDLTLDGGSVFVGENGKKVATADHTHDYDDDDGTSTTTKTTGTPNSGGLTDTEVE